MVILDIDQDFFFTPAFYGKQTEAYRETKHMKQWVSPQEILDRYEIKGMGCKIFTNHNQVLDDILENGYSNIKLIHLDAHSDIEIDENGVVKKSDEPAVGNWVNYLINNGLCMSIDWVYNNPICGNKFPVHSFDYFSHTWHGKIDLVYYTLSPEWCPPNNLIDEFKKGMFR